MGMVRCALYTRKSTDEGLDQPFNSLDAQREACAAFVKSQKGEGWKALPDHYDDGGFSGGTMERPALKRLLDDISSGRVDVVVVYKIDRLTRSLMDFARMVELFDRHSVSFVSVTQAFNTTSSMGRLTLNILLSFAQFEREVTGERIRDKIAASKAKGMWMGGNLPLGYDLPRGDTRALVANEAEAATVRLIFGKYLELGSVHALRDWLDQEGIRSKRWTSRRSKIVGGRPFSRGALFYLLRNRTYLGEIVHQDQSHPGLHQAIIDKPLFDEVQRKLDANAIRYRDTSERVARSPLAGRVFDEDGLPMSPAFTRGKKRQLYRYYVSAPLQQGKQLPDDGSIRRVPGPELEGLVANTVSRFVSDPDPLSVVRRVEVRRDALYLLMPATQQTAIEESLLPGEAVISDTEDAALVRLSIPIRIKFRGGRSWIVGGSTVVTRRDPVLIKALRKAHSMVRTDSRGLPVLDVSPDSPYLRRLVRLAFLAPDLQRAILAGEQPAGLNLEQLMQGSMPISWAEQRALFDGAGMSVENLNRAG
jgi:site-specific DNA recombinase